ncbi:MAG: alpha/beta hydrolase [Reichenbachiella sp.]|uniref:alpha/beta hydrolase n=1 Tax=Reichenbachiella sp. TaxID=2184521 RepID=UPI0032645D7B
MKYEKVTIPSSDGIQLHAWYFPSDLGDQLMIISHDGVGNMGDYLERVRILVNYGFSVLIYDYRGYGASSDFEINKFQYVYKEFYEDFDAVYSYCEERFHHELIAYGWGIGAGISVARGYQKDDIAGIIADEPFVDFTQLKLQFKKINAVMTLPSGIENSNYNALNVVKLEAGDNLRGILYLHGAKNFLYTAEDMELLLNSTSLDIKELYQFDVASRMDNFTVNESEYARQIYAFVLNL